MAAFLEGNELVVYLYDEKEKFIEEVNKGHYTGKKVIETGILEEKISETCDRKRLKLKYVDCRD